MKHNALFQEQLSKVSPEVKKEMEWSAELVDRIEHLLKEKGMTRRELAAAIGCNETQIVRWIRGFPNYTLATLAKLSVALGEDLIRIRERSQYVSGYHLTPDSARQYLSEPESPSYGGSEPNVHII